jgi:hypothetical protein
VPEPQVVPYLGHKAFSDASRLSALRLVPPHGLNSSDRFERRFAANSYRDENIKPLMRVLWQDRESSQFILDRLLLGRPGALGSLSGPRGLL